LSLDLASFILILLYVQFEHSYEKCHPKAENIYRINIEQNRSDKHFAPSHSPVSLAPVYHLLREISR